MQQKKYSFNYLIFNDDFIKRRILINPATHPVGVRCQNRRSRSVSSRRIMRSRALRRSCNIQTGKVNRATASSKLFPMASPKVCCACFWACSERFSPGYVNKPHWLPAVAGRGSSATQTPEDSSRQAQQRGVPEMMTRTGLPPWL